MSRPDLFAARARASLLALALAFAVALAACGSPIPPAGDDTTPPPISDDPGGPTAPAPTHDDIAALDLDLTLVVSGLTAPVGVAHAGDGSGRLFVIERRGLVRLVVDEELQVEPYLDVSALLPSPLQGEQGLLGLAFHPDFASNGRLFVYFSDATGRVVVGEVVADDPGAAALGTRAPTPLLTAEPPGIRHLAGHLAFGPDGYLYVALGDGEAPATARDRGDLFGSLLRLDVDRTDGSLIPDDNPFVDDADARDELWATGLRNPWRFSFDAGTGDLWIADVGQNAVEELNRQPFAAGGGQDYGWPIMEGDRCYQPPVGCEVEGLTLPTLTYDHDDGWGRAVIGGPVYRGEAIDGLRGAYVFGDFVSGDLFYAIPVDGAYEAGRLLESDLALVGFGSDEAGELYAVDFGGGALYRLEER
jgi:glucose/arabinose dehydrogenase